MTPPPSGLAAPGLAEIAARFAAHGLALRGGFDFDPDEDAPARAVLLVGNIGAAHWPHFQAWLSRQPARPSDPLDTWSRIVLAEVAETAGARPVCPSDRPYFPFQRWAMRAEGLKPSPLGILMHPDYGLWHAYRGALLFDRPLAFPETSAQPHPCDTCAGKPCLQACPVGAYTAVDFAYDACLAYVRSESDNRTAFPHSVALRAPPLPPPEGEEGREPAELGLSFPSGGGRGGARSATEWGNHLAPTTALNHDTPSARLCRTAGCRDRNACPVGTAYRYPAEVQAFHMAAFARL